MELFSLKNKYALDFINKSPNSLGTNKNTNSKISNSLSRKDAYICLQSSHISLDFEVLKNDDTRYADGDEIALVNFGPVASFSEAKLTPSSRKHLEKVEKLPIISTMHNPLTSQQTSELMYGFEESVIIRRQELTNNNTEKGTFFVNIKLIDLFGFAIKKE